MGNTLLSIITIVLFLLLCGIYPLGMIRFPGGILGEEEKGDGLFSEKDP